MTPEEEREAALEQLYRGCKSESSRRICDQRKWKMDTKCWMCKTRHNLIYVEEFLQVSTYCRQCWIKCCDDHNLSECGKCGGPTDDGSFVKSMSLPYVRTDRSHPVVDGQYWYDLYDDNSWCCQKCLDEGDASWERSREAMDEEYRQYLVREAGIDPFSWEEHTFCGFCMNEYRPMRRGGSREVCRECCQTPTEWSLRFPCGCYESDMRFHSCGTCGRSWRHPCATKKHAVTCKDTDHGATSCRRCNGPIDYGTFCSRACEVLWSWRGAAR